MDSNNNIQTFEYEGSPVWFKTGENTMINATQMAKPFGKKPNKWLELPSTDEFLKTLQAIRKSDRSELIQTINGVGTWMHEDVALEFARWLSPMFAIWCNDRIKEILLEKANANMQKPSEEKEQIENLKESIKFRTGTLKTDCNTLWDVMCKVKDNYAIAIKAISDYYRSYSISISNLLHILNIEQHAEIDRRTLEKFLLINNIVRYSNFNNRKLVPTPYSLSKEYMLPSKFYKDNNDEPEFTLYGAIRIVYEILDIE